MSLISLEKSQQSLRISLAKVGINNPPLADLAFDLDVSGSFLGEHQDGTTQTLIERLVPWGMVFDPDKKLDVFTFSSGEGNACHVGDITPATCEGYIQSNIVNRVPGYGGGTDYSYVLKKNLQHFGWLQTASNAPTTPKSSLFGRLLRRKSEAAATTTTPVERKRSIIMFVTDGANSDQVQTEQLLAESEARKDEVYFLFIGVSNQGGGFPFLQKIGDRFSNTGLVVIRDMKGFVKKSDDEINNDLIGDELIKWLKK